MVLHAVILHDLDFDRIPVEFFSTCGVAQTAWERVGMPRIPPHVINGVFYLYASKADAIAGTDAGGTGFIVRYDDKLSHDYSANQLYAVTNWHNVAQGDDVYLTIRLNKKDGGVDPIDTVRGDWYFLPDKYDVAVYPLLIDETIHDVSCVSTLLFAGESEIEIMTNRIGVGDDVFMIGLFVDHNGITTNVPSARFGHISMMPDERALIEQETGYQGISYVVDMHSRSGFSGSPVYVYRTFGSDLDDTWGFPFKELEISNWGSGMRGFPLSGRMRVDTLFLFLGIHWAQFPEQWEMHDKSTLKESAKSRKGLIAEGGYVEGFSGMTCVIPAWQIKEVLDMPKLKELRDLAAAAPRKRTVLKPKAESRLRPADDSNPNHLQDFRRLVDVAARKRPQDDQTSPDANGRAGSGTLDSRLSGFSA
jgi:hypothetical protein